jgi:transposase
LVDTAILCDKEVSKKMGKTRPPYPRAFKAQIVALYRAGRTPTQLAREFEPTEQSIREWIAQAERDDGIREDGLASAEKEELVRLRRENRRLRIEREILSKAAAFLARETEQLLPRSSGS